MANRSDGWVKYPMTYELHCQQTRCVKPHPKRDRRKKLTPEQQAAEKARRKEQSELAKQHANTPEALLLRQKASEAAHTESKRIRELNKRAYLANPGQFGSAARSMFAPAPKQKPRRPRPPVSKVEPQDQAALFELKVQRIMAKRKAQVVVNS